MYGSDIQRGLTIDILSRRIQPLAQHSLPTAALNTTATTGRNHVEKGLPLVAKREPVDAPLVKEGPEERLGGKNR
ncbi:hypothetical protein PG989_007254 [Apiospora arundinis]